MLSILASSMMIATRVDEAGSDPACHADWPRRAGAEEQKLPRFNLAAWTGK